MTGMMMMMTMTMMMMMNELYLHEAIILEFCLFFWIILSCCADGCSCTHMNDDVTATAHVAGVDGWHVHTQQKIHITQHNTHVCQP